MGGVLHDHRRSKHVDTLKIKRNYSLKGDGAAPAPQAERRGLSTAYTAGGDHIFVHAATNAGLKEIQGKCAG
jgi:hypothetical protein